MQSRRLKKKNCFLINIQQAWNIMFSLGTNPDLQYIKNLFSMPRKRSNANFHVISLRSISSKQHQPFEMQ